MAMTVGRCTNATRIGVQCTLRWGHPGTCQPDERQPGYADPTVPIGERLYIQADLDRAVEAERELWRSVADNYSMGQLIDLVEEEREHRARQGGIAAAIKSAEEQE